MARPIRLEFPGALYHITSRGNRRDNIVEDDIDRELMLKHLDQVCELYNWKCHAYCLMDNHYHLLIETPDSNLSRGMRQFNGNYTQAYNRRHNRVGHVFQGRYKSILVDKDSYLLEVGRYIVLNPVRAKMVRSVRDWPWSSYRATIGLSPALKCLSTDWFLSNFAKRKSIAIEKYKLFVREGIKGPPLWDKLKQQILLGSDAFIEQMQEKIDQAKDISEVPLAQRRPIPASLKSYEMAAVSRNIAIYDAYTSGGYTLKEIGDHFDLHYSTVSGVIRNHKSKTPCAFSTGFHAHE
ncbi:MAG: putative transposase [Parasphingorhabdus sp.]|jgi:putative transposase